jgi:flagellar assembly protein FliH
MLSKVVGRADAGLLQGVVFPQVSGYGPGMDGRGSSEESRDRSGKNGNDESGDVGKLRERLHHLESQSAAENRVAFDAGRQQGEQHARAELQPVLDRLNASITQVTAMRPDLRRRAERDVVQLALLIAKRVLHRQVNVDEEALTAIARVAFERLSRSESYRLTVHPRFVAALTAALPGNHAARVQIDPDPGCAPGTLIIHSAEGTIDASIDVQLEEISRGLTDRLAIA